MVQLSVLLCLIPLTLENAMMQAHVTQVCHSVLSSAAPQRMPCRVCMLHTTGPVDVPMRQANCRLHWQLGGKLLASCMTHSPELQVAAGNHSSLLVCMQECLPHIIAALDTHFDEVDIQTKAVVLLGVLIQVTTEHNCSVHTSPSQQ